MCEGMSELKQEKCVRSGVKMARMKGVDDVVEDCGVGG